MSMPDEVPVSITDQRLRETEQLLREAFAAAAQSVTPTVIRVPRPADRPERSWSRWLPRAAEKAFGTTTVIAIAMTVMAAAAANGISTCS